jgi:hypothetical protein
MMHTNLLHTLQMICKYFTSVVQGSIHFIAPRVQKFCFVFVDPEWAPSSLGYR